MGQSATGLHRCRYRYLVVAGTVRVGVSAGVVTNTGVPCVAGHRHRCPFRRRQVHHRQAVEPSTPSSNRRNHQGRSPQHRGPWDRCPDPSTPSLSSGSPDRAPSESVSVPSLSGSPSASGPNPSTPVEQSSHPSASVSLQTNVGSYQAILDAVVIIVVIIRIADVSPSVSNSARSRGHGSRSPVHRLHRFRRLRYRCRCRPGEHTSIEGNTVEVGEVIRVLGPIQLPAHLVPETGQVAMPSKAFRSLTPSSSESVSR